MISDMAQADAEMAELFRQAWEVTGGYKTDWPNAKTEDHAGDEIWARWALDYVAGGQRSMGGGGNRKFAKMGLIYMTVFSPLGFGLGNARAASQIALSAYEGKRTPNDVWFRNVRIDSEGHGQGTGRNKSWWTTVVIAEFTYDYLR
jgi:hypothetical protein